MPLKTASEMKTLAGKVDLTPILDNIAGTIENAAVNGDLSVDVTIKDSIYEKQLVRISTTLTTAGYDVVINGSNLFISWENAK